MIEAEFRPIESWPGERTPPSKRQPIPFKASYHQTLDLLERELAHLKARDIVIELAVGFHEIRNDGWPRANAKPGHPGVIVSFDSEHGPLRYFTDVFEGRWSGDMPDWQANLRAIALGLEALRKVDRYGIGKRGEQYTGWSALPPGTIAAGAGSMTVEQAANFLAQHAHSAATPADAHSPGAREVMYRRAAKHLHPDAGGTTELFQRLEEAKRVLDGGGRP